MGQVIALDDFRRECRGNGGGPLAELSPPARPQFTAGDVWGRDYTRMEDVVYGLLTARQAMRYYTRYDEHLESLFLEVLEAVHQLEETGIARLHEAIAPLKDHLIAALDEQNTKHLKTALILLDLIEKSPLYR